LINHTICKSRRQIDYRQTVGKSESIAGGGEADTIGFTADRRLFFNEYLE
jgi:hypothetical protein